MYDMLGLVYSLADTTLAPDGMSPAELRNLFKKAKVFKFDMTFIKSQCEIEEFMQPATQFANDALKYGAFRLPFDVCLYHQIMYNHERLFLCCGGAEAYFHGWEISNGKIVRYDADARIFGNAIQGRLSIKVLPHEWEQDAYKTHMDIITGTPAALTGLLNSRGVQSRTVKQSRQIKRRNDRTAAFGYDYTELTIRNRQAGEASPTGKGSTKRLHWRRGHFRRLPDGRLTSVRPCLVGDKKLGFVEHNYIYSGKQFG